MLASQEVPQADHITSAVCLACRHLQRHLLVLKRHGKCWTQSGVTKVRSALIAIEIPRSIIRRYIKCILSASIPLQNLYYTEGKLAHNWKLQMHPTQSVGLSWLGCVVPGSRGSSWVPLPPPACSDSADGLLLRLIWRCEMLRCRPIAAASAVGDDPRCELDRDGPCLRGMGSSVESAYQNRKPGLHRAG